MSDHSFAIEFDRDVIEAFCRKWRIKEFALFDEDYDGDCFVDCQIFFDFKKTPNIKGLFALKSTRTSSR